MKEHPYHEKPDPLGLQTGLQLAAGGLFAMMLMRWLGMQGGHERE